MSILQEIEAILGVTLPEPFNYIVACLVFFFMLACVYNFIKVIFRLFGKSRN